MTQVTKPQAVAAEPQPPAKRSVPLPLLPVALAATAGIIMDRFAQPAPALAIIGIAGALVVWVRSWRKRSPASVLWLWLLTFFLAAAWHRLCHVPYPNDISRHAGEEGRPVKLRGWVWTDPETPPPDPAPLRTIPITGRTSVLLRAGHVALDADWLPAQGYVKLNSGTPLAGLTVGDEVEVFGLLELIPPPGNPGENDWQAYFGDQEIRAMIRAKTADAVAVRQPASMWSLDSSLARLRAWGAAALRNHVDDRRAGVAVALLLGDQSALTPAQFDGYLRTGVYHVLAVSGQHLVILCAGLEIVLCLLGVSRRRSALLLLAFVWMYASLTGSRPPVVRAAVIMTVWCGGWIVRRPMQPLNSLALAWLVVALANPSDLFQTGCQLSFLAVLVLMTVVRPVYGYRMMVQNDPVVKLLRESRPKWLKALLDIWSWFAWSVATSLVIWLLASPLLAARFHLVSPAAILLSAIMIPLTAVALLAGFLCLLLSPLGLGSLAGWFVNISLAGCEWSVWLGERVPGGYWYVSNVHEWWLWTFYLLLLALLLFQPLQRIWRRALVAGAVWLIVGLAAHRPPSHPEELRCTFLAVGHGGCVVVETPEGRVFIYDAGSVGGPDVTARQIAPFLWSRGLTKIDEIFVSHADLDHFNGLPALLARFRVGQVSRTPSFVAKPIPGVKLVTDLLTARGVPARVLSRGQLLRSGQVAIQVLHPPLEGPPGNENARSMVLLVEFAGRSLLLTGDLEQPGLGEVVALPAPAVDVMLAPHHGSPASNIDLFARWARPALVVSSEGRERGRRPDPYAAYGGTVWRTWKEGSVTVIIDAKGIRAETFRTGKRWIADGALAKRR
jgi:competence protein ComEC